MLDIAYRIRHRDFRRFGLAAMTVFETSRGQTPLPDHDPMWDAHELRIGEFDPRAGVPIVQQNIDAGGVELLVQRVGGLLHQRRFLVVDGHEDDLKRRDGFRPENAVVIVILFDGGRNDPRDSDSIAAMNIVSALPCSSRTLACMASLYSCPSWKMCPTSMPRAISSVPWPVGLGSPRCALRMSTACGSSRSRPPIHAAEMHVLLVGSADEIRQVSGGVIDIDAAGKTDGSDEAGLGAGGFAHPLGARHPQGIGHPRQLLRLHRVQFMIAADHQGHYAAVRAVDQQGLHAAFRLHAQCALNSAMVRAFGVDILASGSAAAGRGPFGGMVAAISRLAA